MSTTNNELSTDHPQERSRRSTRRAFLRDGFLAAGVTGFAIRGVLAQARQAGKPAFTAATANKLLAKSSEERYRAMFAQEAQQDFESFLRKTFYLTPRQERYLHGLSTEQVHRIQMFLKESVDKKRRVKIEVTYGSHPVRPKKGELLVSFSNPSETNGQQRNDEESKKGKEPPGDPKSLKLLLMPESKNSKKDAA